MTFYTTSRYRGTPDYLQRNAVSIKYSSNYAKQFNMGPLAKLSLTDNDHANLPTYTLDQSINSNKH